MNVQKDDILKLKEQHPREWAIFSQIDTNNDGVIDKGELKTMCEQFGLGDLTDIVVQLLDRDNDEKITFQELLAAFADIQALRTEARQRYWNSCFGLGVAGNVASLMAQAGEADEEEPQQTKPDALFAFYVPQGSKERLSKNQQSRLSLLRKKGLVETSQRLESRLDRLERFPVTNAVIEYPRLDGAERVQVEPKFALLCDIVYHSDVMDSKIVEALLPRKVAAFNDCSIRKLQGAEKLSEKKNWGFGQKGISLDSFILDKPSEFTEGGCVSHLGLTSYIKRDGQIRQYTETVTGKNYLLFYEPLLEWICDQLNHQQSLDTWENMADLLEAANYPSSMWIALGASEFTKWGQKNYILPKDETVAIVFDKAVYGKDGPSLQVVEQTFNDEVITPEEAGRKALVYLHQTFVETKWQQVK